MQKLQVRLELLCLFGFLANIPRSSLHSQFALRKLGLFLGNRLLGSQEHIALILFSEPGNALPHYLGSRLFLLYSILSCDFLCFRVLDALGFLEVIDLLRK